MVIGTKTVKDSARSAIIPTLKRVMSADFARRVTKEISSCAINAVAGIVRHVQVSPKLNFWTSLIKLISV